MTRAFCTKRSQLCMTSRSEAYSSYNYLCSDPPILGIEMMAVRLVAIGVSTWTCIRGLLPSGQRIASRGVRNSKCSFWLFRFEITDINRPQERICIWPANIREPRISRKTIPKRSILLRSQGATRTTNEIALKAAVHSFTRTEEQHENQHRRQD
jgi:hypothetical protein